jgi:hypothetical protein
LSACRGGDYTIKPDSLARAMNLPDADRVRAAVRARDEDNEATWVRAANLHDAKTASDGLVHARAPRRRQAAVAALVFGIVSVAALGAGAAGTYEGFNGSNIGVAGIGLIGVAVGAGGLVASIVIGTTQMTKPESEVKPGRTDLVYVP